MDFLKKYIRIYWKKYIIVLIFLTLEAICDLLQPTIMSKIIDNGVAAKNLNYVFHMGGIMLLVTVIGAVNAATRNIISSRVSQKFGTELRGDLFKKVQSFSFDNINKFQGATLITRLTNDVTQVQNFAHGMMRIFVKAPILCIGSLIMAVLLNPPMALILIGVIPVIFFIIYLNVRISYPFFVKIQIALDKLNEVMRQYLSGVRVVKAFNRFAYELDEFKISNDNLTNASITGMKVVSIFNPIITLVINLGIVVILWVGGIKVNNGSMQVGKIIAFINYMTQILFSLVMMSHVFTMFIRAKASAERIGEVFDQENSLREIDSPADVKNIKGKIEFKNVDFTYSGSLNPVLKNISFVCNPGEMLAIVGSTGSGKTSLINLIPRFYDVTSGELKIDEINVNMMNLKELRDIIAIVPQKTMLFSGNILENIKWGNENASVEEVQDAAKIAQAHEFIMSFPEKYTTQLGQGGVNLSGGQKQRISLARALLKKPKILILDDSTSAVDMTTEGKIRRGLKLYLKNTTCIFIAQRITTIREANRIIVLDNGMISAIGTHEELMKNSDIYKDIYYSQMGREDAEYGK